VPGNTHPDVPGTGPFHCMSFFDSEPGGQQPRQRSTLARQDAQHPDNVITKLRGGPDNPTMSTPSPGPRFLRLTDFSEELNISASQTYALVRIGELPAIQIGGRNQWRVERSIRGIHPGGAPAGRRQLEQPAGGATRAVLNHYTSPISSRSVSPRERVCGQGRTNRQPRASVHLRQTHSGTWHRMRSNC
jgi:hypothetical protein